MKHLTKLSRRMVVSVFVLTLATGQLSAVIRNVAAGSTQAQIQTIINSSASGDTISFASGTYNFTSALTLKSGLVVQGNGCTWNGNNTSNIVKVVDAASLSNVTINNLTANNVMFRLWGSPGASAVNNVTFTNIKFQNGRAESGLAQIDSRYLQFKANNVTVSGCTFLRTSSFPGKCLHLYLAEGMSFTGNKVGTTSSTSPNPSTYGYFKTAINMNSDSVTGGLVNATISNNTISGWPAATPAAQSKSVTARMPPSPTTLSSVRVFQCMFTRRDTTCFSATSM